MSLQQTISSATPTALTGFAAPAMSIYITNTDSSLIVDVYLNNVATPYATVNPNTTIPLAPGQTGIAAVKLAAPSGSPVIVWGYINKSGWGA